MAARRLSVRRHRDRATLADVVWLSYLIAFLWDRTWKSRERGKHFMLLSNTASCDKGPLNKCTVYVIVFFILKLHVFNVNVLLIYFTVV